MEYEVQLHQDIVERMLRMLVHKIRVTYYHDYFQLNLLFYRCACANDNQLDVCKIKKLKI